MKRYTASEVEPRFRARRLKYPKSTRLSASIAELFGAPLTPEEAVRRIVSEVAEEGDPALDRWGQRLDRSPAYEVPKKQWREAYDGLASDLREALEAARTRIRDFHRQEPRGGFVKAGPDGLTGQLVRPLERVGVYVPGGGAPLLSTVLMTVVPARVAGVKEIIIATPPDPHPAILAAASLRPASRWTMTPAARTIAWRSSFSGPAALRQASSITSWTSKKPPWFHRAQVVSQIPASGSSSCFSRAYISFRPARYSRWAGVAARFSAHAAAAAKGASSPRRNASTMPAERRLRRSRAVRSLKGSNCAISGRLLAAEAGSQQEKTAGEDEDAAGDHPGSGDLVPEKVTIEH